MFIDSKNVILNGKHYCPYCGAVIKPSTYTDSDFDTYYYFQCTCKDAQDYVDKIQKINKLENEIQHKEQEIMCLRNTLPEDKWEIQETFVKK